jgi:hypothetical protein
MGCEVPSPCGEQEEQDTQCDYCTVVADEMSKFAGMMCRKPFTEYCNAATATTDFCTNGGKCKASFVAAHLAPRNTTANSQFASLGCICNPAFYGPHCELLKLPHHADQNLLDPEKFTTASEASSTSSTSETTRDSESDNSNSSSNNTSSDNSSSNNISSDSTSNSLDLTSVFSVTVLAASVASFLIVVAATVAIRRYRHRLVARRRHHGHAMPFAGSGVMRVGEEAQQGHGSAAEFASLTRAGRNII